jgi:hypothetical protein
MLRAQQEEADSPRVLEWEVNYKIAVSDFTQPPESPTPTGFQEHPSGIHHFCALENFARYLESSTG